MIVSGPQNGVRKACQKLAPSARSSPAVGEPLSKQMEEPSDRAGRNDQRGRGRSIGSRRRCREGENGREIKRARVFTSCLLWTCPCRHVALEWRVPLWGLCLLCHLWGPWGPSDLCLLYHLCLLCLLCLSSLYLQRRHRS